MLDALWLREDPIEKTRELTLRTMQVRAATLDEENRSVEAVLATETPALLYDWRAGEVVEEVLRADGADLPAQLPLLDIHNRWTLDAVLGSIRSLRRDGDTIVGRLFFAEKDETAERAWNKVRQGHLTDVSVGYQVREFTDIPAGQTSTVGGKQYTAGKRSLRISTAWTLREGSLVPIGADPAAKIREAGKTTHHSPLTKETTSMGTRVKKYLIALGLSAEATDEEAQRFLAALEGRRADVANVLQIWDANDPSETAGRMARAALAELGVEPDQPHRERAAPPARPPANQPPASQPRANQPPADPGAAATAAERQRVARIQELARDDVPADLARRAVSEGWDEGRASQEFLSAVREGRAPSAGRGPAIHSHGHDQDVNARSLAAGLLIGAGIDPVARQVAYRQNTDERGSLLTEQDADRGHELRCLSARDLVRECALLDTGRVYRDPAMAFRAAVSGGTLSYVFGTNVYARLVEGWQEVSDTTAWCDSEDVPNFLTQEDISLEAQTTLKRLPRGDTAKDATLSDSHETYKLARYARKFVVDSQDILDDRLGAIMNMPREMGMAAARLRPDLVYALLLANAVLADTGALFNNTAVTTAGGHANLTTAVLGATGMKAAILAMGKYRSSDKAALNIKPRFLIVPSALQWTAKELLTSTAQAYTAAAAAATPALYYPINVLVGENITLVVDDRIGAAGVIDPTTGTARVGLDTNWFLSSGGPRTVRVAYRQGTGRAPEMRGFTLDKGQWGIGWDINMDIGAKALDYRGLHKSAGTG